MGVLGEVAEGGLAPANDDAESIPLLARIARREPLLAMISIALGLLVFASILSLLLLVWFFDLASAPDSQLFCFTDNCTTEPDRLSGFLLGTCVVPPIVVIACSALHFRWRCNDGSRDRVQRKLAFRRQLAKVSRWGVAAVAVEVALLAGFYVEHWTTWYRYVESEEPSIDVGSRYQIPAVIAIAGGLVALAVVTWIVLRRFEQRARGIEQQ